MYCLKDNGNIGSGNWGHKGRKGQVGGSKKGNNNKERVIYGRNLRILYEKLQNNKVNKNELINKADIIYKNHKLFAKRCFKIYKETLQGRTVKSLDGKLIYLGRRGADETISKGNPAMLPKADKLIETTDFNIEELPYKERRDKAISFLKGINKKILNKEVKITLRKRKEKNKDFIDLYLMKKQ